MTLNIKVNLDNEAFAENNTVEVTNILHSYINKILRGGYLLAGDKETLLDHNGNSVGVAKVVN